MVWQRILKTIAGSNKNRGQSKRRRRRLLMQKLDRREVLASNIAAISGIAFVDNNGDDTLDAGDTRVVGTQITLYADDGAGNAGTLVTTGPNADTSVDTTITAGNGSYRFSGLGMGDYFLVQDSFGGIAPPAPVLVNVTADNADGEQIVPIDDFTSGDQLASAAGMQTVMQSVAAPTALGQERNIQLTHTNASGNTTFQVDTDPDGNPATTGGLMGLSTGVNALARVIVEYDGVDNAFGLNLPPGFTPTDLTGGNTDLTSVGLELLVRAENQDENLDVTIYSSAANSSTRTITIPTDADLQSVFVPFSTFTGTADFTNVVGVRVEAEVTLENNDIFFSVVESRGPDVVPQNLLNEQLVGLGGTIFEDDGPLTQQNNGVFDPAEGALGTGIEVELYPSGGSFDPANRVAVTNTISGDYSFDNLEPGEYVVVIRDSEFQGGGPLFGYTNSMGEPNTDLNVDNDDDGRVLAGVGVVSAPITLIAGDEPIDDGDTDPNTNLTVDFGFFPQMDLQITKTLNTTLSNVQPGGSAIFDILVENLGPRSATDVEVEDMIPDGLTYNPATSDFGTLPDGILDNGTLTVSLGTLPAGGDATFRIGTTIDASQTTDIINEAEVTGREIETDLTNNDDQALVDLTEADLSITKTDDNDPISAGTQLIYTITVMNDGPEMAMDVIATDTLPDDVTFVSGNFTTGSGTVTEGPSGTLTIDIGDLADGESAVIDITVDVDQDADSPLNNTASVISTPNNDPNMANNNTAEPTIVQRDVDVAVDKLVMGTPVAGGEITYSITVSNDGPGIARDVMVVDVLNGALSYVDGSFDQGTSNASLDDSGQNLNFDVGTLGVGESVEFFFDVAIDSAARSNIPNTAQVSTSDNDTDDSNDSDTEIISPLNQVDLMLTKIVDESTAVPGQDQLVYTITIEHDSDSPSDAFDVVVTDVIPDGLSNVVFNAPGSTSSDFNNVTETLTVNYDTIPVGATREITITANVDADATGEITNPADVDVNFGTELDTGNNDDTAQTTLTPQFDVEVTKTARDSDPAPGENVSYDIDIRNNGPSTATGVVLADDIPAGLSFVSGSLNGQDATQVAGNVVFPSITLDPGQEVDATLIFEVDVDASGDITNTASATSDDGETNLDNNSDTATITATPVVDIEVDKSVSPDFALPGATVVYTIEVTNNGPSTATNVVAVDSLPDGVTFQSGIGPNGEALTADGNVVTVNGGDLADGDSFSFTINVTVNAGVTEDQTNEVVVSTDTSEAIVSNNFAEAIIELDSVMASLAGTVYLDLDNDGIQDENEDGIPNVLLRLTGTDQLGNSVNRELTTDANGDYLFANLPAGTYQLEETQPSPYRDGQDTAGTGAASVDARDDLFANLELDPGAQAVEFNFGERIQALSKRRFLASFDHLL